MGAALSLRRVRRTRDGREVLRIDDLDIDADEHVSVLGPNGAGKTTLLRLLAGVDRPSAGTVTLDDVSMSRGGVELRRRVAYAAQRPVLLSTSVRRNVELPLRWRKVPRRERARMAAAALERLRVTHLADRPARELSGGEQQRVNLARALALDPSVLLLDEPAAGLDAATRSAFFADLEQALADRAITVVHVSHRAEEALRFADRVVVLVAGRVHQIGTPESLYRRPADPSVAALVGYDDLLDATVGPEGSVLVGGEPTGLVHRGRLGPPVTVAVFAGGVRLVDAGHSGLTVRVARVTPGPGHRVLALESAQGEDPQAPGAAPGGRSQRAVSLLAHLPIDVPAPSPGEVVRVVFDPGLSAVLPRTAPLPALGPDPGHVPIHPRASRRRSAEPSP